MSAQWSEVLSDLETAQEAAQGAPGAFTQAVAARAEQMRATGVRITTQARESGVSVRFEKTGSRGYAPATVADKAVKRLVETGGQALSEVTQ